MLFFNFGKQISTGGLDRNRAAYFRIAAFHRVHLTVP